MKKVKKEKIAILEKRNEKIVKISVICVKIKTFCGLINCSFGYNYISSEGMTKKIPPLCLNFFCSINFFTLHYYEWAQLKGSSINKKQEFLPQKIQKHAKEVFSPSPSNHKKSSFSIRLSRKIFSLAAMKKGEQKIFIVGEKKKTNMAVGVPRK